MIRPFEFTSVPKIVFGRGTIAQLGDLARPFGGIALLMHNGDDPGRGGPVDRATASLSAGGITVIHYRQRGEPTIADVDAALTVARREKCELIVGLGGGSAIDAAKATAGLLTNGGDCLDYMEVIGKGRKITKPAAPWIAVPTTAGTGAEVTRNAVIGSPERKFKASIRSEHLLARVALVDPELHVGVSPEVTAASGMDALCQCIEAYTSTGATPLTDALAVNGALTAGITIVAAFKDGSDLEQRGDMALAALMSGICLTNSGLGAVHGFAAPIGANFPVPHGVVCARLLSPVIGANLAALRAEDFNHLTLFKYAKLGGVFRGRPDLMIGLAGNALREYIHELVKLLKIPRLGDFGLREDHISEMVTLAKKTSSMKYNPVVLADDVLADILRSAL
jgi:alcohol dehydrogenase class IV